MDNIIKEYLAGDMLVRYIMDPTNGGVGMQLLPASCHTWDEYREAAYVEPLVQIKLLGDIYPGSFAQGNTMRGSGTIGQFRYIGQQCQETKERVSVITILEDARGYELEHHLSWMPGGRYVRVSSLFRNNSSESVVLESLSSFSFGDISPFLKGDGREQLYIHRLRSRWSMEGRRESVAAEDLQLETAWNGEAVRVERFGQVGSMPVNNFFPFLAAEDRENEIFWGMQLNHGASWQMELWRREEKLSVSGGLADREYGHWMKQVLPGAQFQAPEAVLTVCRTSSLDICSDRLLDYAADAMNVLASPAQEKELPIIFNEYCTTWGNPSHDNISRILEAIKDRGFTYFVIDCGWYKAPGVPWDISMGDYEPSAEFFPEGLKKTTDAIRAAGMKPGIWFELENVGRMANAYTQTEHLLKRDGYVLTTALRRFWDMSDPWVEEYLTDKVINQLNEYGFEYIKIDYNDTIGIGCDGAESPGEGLRQNIEATKQFYQKIRREVPGIVMENCASGGHRLEPGFMGITDMASFSDAHECEEIPIIAANMHRVIQPRQSQIWAVIRKEDSQQRIIYSVAATFLGRMCISGDVTELDEEQWQIIEDGMAFYRGVAPIIKSGTSFRYGPEVRSYRHPEGWQAVVRAGHESGILVVIHVFGGSCPAVIEVPLPDSSGEEIKAVYGTSEDIHIENQKVRYYPQVNKSAVALWLK